MSSGATSSLESASISTELARDASSASECVDRDDRRKVCEELQPTPIFVIGMARSGTKWLSNLISTHKDVASVQNERHRGILETSVFDATQSKFDLTSDDDFAAFIELWSRSDFFRAAETDPQLFYHLPPSQRDFLRLFEILMNDLARRRGCCYWLQKISAHVACRILQQFPKARAVIIKRRLVDVLRSQAALNARQGRPRAVYQTTYDYVIQEKYAACIRRRFPHVAFVTYDDLLSNTDAKIREICGQLGLSNPAENLRSEFQANTSFSQSKTPLPRRQELGAMMLAVALRLTPLWAMKGFSALKRILRGPVAEPFYSGEFGLLKDRLKAPPQKEAI